MSSNRKYQLLLVISMIVLVIIELNSPKPVNWKQTYSRYDKVPYGSFLLYQELKTLFPDHDIISSEDPIIDAEDILYGDDVLNMIFVHNELNFDEVETDVLLEFAESGGYIFAAANQFRGAFQDSLNLALNIFPSLEDSIGSRFNNPQLEDQQNYYYRRPGNHFHFARFDKEAATVIGTTSEGKPNLLKYEIGEGAIIVSSKPLAFTNFNLLEGDNGRYMFTALSYLPVGKTYWDEYYKPFKRHSTSPLRVILNDENLRSAWRYTLLALLLFLIFQGRRKQQIIPVIKPLQNTTVEFVKTVGRLYFHHSNHHNLATKQINHFMDYLRTRYFLKTDRPQAELIDELVERSTIDRSKIEALFSAIRQVQQTNDITESSLIKLNDLLGDFYRESEN